MNKLRELQKSIRSHAEPLRAKNCLWFFKTGKGDYGEGDKFLGLTVPLSRRLTKQYLISRTVLDIDTLLVEMDELIRSQYHEERLIALLILVEKFAQADDKEKTAIVKFYLAHTKWINNWDLVDLSAHKIVGAYLGIIPKDPKIPGQAGNDKPHPKDGPSGKREILFKLAKSKNLWERRIAIVSTFAFIRDNNFTDSLKLADILLNDRHDLMHKAVGWMLREVGKKDITVLTKFLKPRYQKMPRTMLRYAIEKFPEEIRRAYLRGTI
ncbi:MAG: DNA alkylation repair protein [Candidatus Vogelbacteria bacterium]|nr:DNA alkylation repair protein [Candidatus Vogelbacteria bacterium]